MKKNLLLAGVAVFMSIAFLAQAALLEPMAVVEQGNQVTRIRLGDLSEGEQIPFHCGEHTLMLSKAGKDFKVVLDGKQVLPAADNECCATITGDKEHKVKIVIKKKPGDKKLDSDVPANLIGKPGSDCECENLSSISGDKHVVIKKIINEGEDVESVSGDKHVVIKKIVKEGDDTEIEEDCCDGGTECCKDESITIDGEEIAFESLSYVKRLVLKGKQDNKLKLTILGPSK